MKIQTNPFLMHVGFIYSDTWKQKGKLRKARCFLFTFASFYSRVFEPQSCFGPDDVCFFVCMFVSFVVKVLFPAMMLERSVSSWNLIFSLKALVALSSWPDTWSLTRKQFFVFDSALGITFSYPVLKASLSQSEDITLYNKAKGGMFIYSFLFSFKSSPQKFLG